MPDPIEELSYKFASAARGAWEYAADAVDRLASAVTPANEAGSSLERFVRPPLERGAAAVRWSPINPLASSVVVPLPAPSLDDPRMLLTVVGLAKVLYEEVEEHRLASGGGSNEFAGGSAPVLPLPPVTIAMAAAAVWRYFNPVLLRQVCLSPYCVVDRREYGRLWSSCLVHLDAPHLLSNLAAMLADSAEQERRVGSAEFAADVAVLSALSSGLFVGWAVLEKEVFKRSTSYYAVGAVGMSALIFALQVVRGEARRGSSVAVLGAVQVPAPYAWVVQLAYTVFAAPQSSFTGHLCGVLAGIAHVYVLKPVMRLFLRSPSSHTAGQGRPRFYGAGTLSGRPVSGRTDPSGRRPLRGALTQLALAAASVVVYVVVTSRSRSGRPTVSDWRLR